MIKKIHVLLTKIIDLENFFPILGSFCLLPFLLLSFFNHPSTDDFVYHQVSKLFGFFDAQIYWYENWSGRYAASAFSSIKNLLDKDLVNYKILPLFFFTVLSISLFYFWKEIFKQFQITISERSFCINFLFFFLICFLYQLPSAVQSFYWMGGSITYLLPSILTLILFIQIIKLIQNYKIGNLVLAILSLFIIIGSNETSMIIITFILLNIIVYNYVVYKKIHKSLLILLLCSLVFSAIVISAPGNHIRLAKSPNAENLNFSFSQSLLKSKAYIIQWTPFLIIITILFTDLFKADINKIRTRIFDVNPYYVILMTVFIMVMGFLPASWGTGRPAPGRTVNVIYFFFILGLLYTLILFLKKYYTKVGGLYRLNNVVKYSLVIILLLFFFNDNNIKIAYKDIIGGSAIRYHSELNKRYRLIRECPLDTCYVPAIVNKPRILYNKDISTEDNNWNNQTLGEFFGKLYIKLEN